MIYTVMTKLIEDCGTETQAASKSVSKTRSKLSQNENATQGQKATGILQTVQTKSKTTTVRVTVTTGDTEGLPCQCHLCRRPQPTIDANHRRHPSTPPFIADHPHHRRHRSHPGHGHYHSPNPTSYQLLLHFDIVYQSRTSGSISFPDQFRRGAQPKCWCILSQHIYDSYLFTVKVPSHYHQVL